MNRSQKIIAITGAESTGKSTLVKQLAAFYHAPFIPEIAREYIEKLEEHYIYADVVKIAKKQIYLFEAVKKENQNYVFLDTWLIITKVWFNVVYKKEPDWLDRKIRNSKIDLFLICDVDLPWIPDPVRENGGTNRLKLQKKYIEMIDFYKFDYKIVSGTNDTRFNNAVKIINKL